MIYGKTEMKIKDLEFSVKNGVYLSAEKFSVRKL